MQFGGGRLGSVATAAGGAVAQTLANTPRGPVDAYYLQIAFSGKSSAGAFAAVVNTAGSAAAEGVDDLDLTLNTLFTLIQMFLDPQNLMFALTPAQLRTILGLLNQRDFISSFSNAVSVPASGGSATAFVIQIRIPLSLAFYFADGGMFRQGSKRCSTGQMIYTIGTSLTPSIVLANGTMVVSAFSAITLNSEAGAGTDSDVGPSWSVTRSANNPTNYNMGPGTRLAILDSNPSATSAVTNWMVGPYELWSPAIFGAKYQSERLAAGGYDITARATPLLWIEPGRTVYDFLSVLNVPDLNIQAVSGVSSLTIYDLKMNAPSQQTIEAVAQAVGAGGPVSKTIPAPRSVQPGSDVPQQLQAILPVRIQPGSTPGGQTAANPAQLRQDVAAAQNKARSTASILSRFKR